MRQTPSRLQERPMVGETVKNTRKYAQHTVITRDPKTFCLEVGGRVLGKGLEGCGLVVNAPSLCPANHENTKIWSTLPT